MIATSGASRKNANAIAHTELYRHGLHHRQENWLTAYWYLWLLGGLGGVALLACGSIVSFVLARFFAR